MPYRPDKPELEPRRRHGAWLWLILVVVILAIAGWLYNRFGLSSAPEPPTASIASVAPAPAASTNLPETAPAGAPALPSFPVPTTSTATPATASAAALKPPSEASFFDALKGVLGKATSAGVGAASALPIDVFPISEGLVRRIVATVDALGRNGPIPVRVRPVPPPPGLPDVTREGSQLTWSDANCTRYQPFIETLSRTDIRALVRVYFHYYPLFQQAYERLGFPNGYFNDRLVQVVDLMIATPSVTPPIVLTQPQVLYQFADPTLEALPAGQKLMIRIGPRDEELVRAKLRELRAALVAGHPNG
ncbi:MAG TPA: DUF3014 domain-containing protein [Nevskiaceae bacterium]